MRGVKSNVVNLDLYRFKKRGVKAIHMPDFEALDDEDVIAFIKMLNPRPPGVKLVDDDKPSDT